MNLLSRLLWRKTETYEQARARMIAETSEYITECLKRPELAVKIPVIKAGTGRFPRSLTGAFWGPVLDE